MPHVQRRELFSFFNYGVNDFYRKSVTRSRSANYEKDVLGSGGCSSRQKKVNCVSCGCLQELDRQISESADYPDEGSGCEKLSRWQGMDVRAEWDGFRCLVFRNEENIFLQSNVGKSLTSGFPEIVAAFRDLSPKRFVLDGELAMPTANGFSFDGLVHRLRIGSARLALEVRDSPAIYIAFDMLANSENLLGSPFRLRRKTLERFFENSVPRSSPLYLSASTEDLREVEKWVGHIGQQLDGIIAKRADAPYRPGDDHSTVKIPRKARCKRKISPQQSISRPDYRRSL